MSGSGENTGGEGDGKRVPLAVYAELYGSSERTVKRWNATGRSAGDPPPLENPERMLAWWQRNMTQRVPDGISAAVIQQRKNQPASAAPPMELPLVVPVIAEDKASARKALLEMPIDENAIGPEQTLRRLLELEPRLHRFATDPGQAKDYLATVARIGPAQKALTDENERLRKLIPRAEAESAIQSLHVPIKNETYLLAAGMCQALGLPLTPEIEEKWRVECDRLFHRLQTEVFA